MTSAKRAGGGGLREARLFRIHELLPSLVDDSGEIGQPHILALQPQIQQQVDACQGRRTGAADDHFDLRNALADDLQSVEACGADDDGGAMLIVMEHRNFHAAAQFALDDETFRRLDILQIDGAERRFQRRNDFDQLLRIALLDLDIENIDAREFLEQHRLAFHHRLGRERSDGAKPKHRGAVADHPDQIASRGKPKHIERIFDYRLAGGSDSRRIRERQVALVQQLLGGGDR